MHSVFKPYFIFHTLKNYTHFVKTMSTGEKPIETLIRKKLVEGLNTSYLEVINESYMHNVPKNSETHFKVVVVSDKFKNISLIQRHRLVNDLLKDELTSSIHALSIIAKTPDQWQNSEKIVEPSPACRGGFGK